MKKAVMLLVIAAVLFVAAQNISSLLELIGLLFTVSTPLILGSAIAFIINMPMRFFEQKIRRIARKKKRKLLTKLARPISVIISIILVLASLSLIALIIMPEVANTILTISNNVPSYINNIIKWSQDMFEKYPQIEQHLKGIEIDWNQINGTLLQMLRGSAEAILGSTFSIATNVVGGITNFFMSCVLAIYILFQKEKLSYHAKRALKAFIPDKVGKYVLKIATLTSKTFSRFLTGQCLEAIILGTLVFIGMSICGFPYALMISVLIAVMSFIPMFGIYVASAIGAVLIAFQGGILSGVLFYAMFLGIQQIEGNFIYPRVVGNSVGLSPLVVLASVIVGGGLFGFVGMIISVPVSAVLLVLYKEIVEKRLKKIEMQAQELMPEDILKETAAKEDD